MENNDLKPYYVYELRDPATDEVFYVGKGQGTRANEHEREALNCEGNDSAKISKIREIQARPDDSENRVKIVVVGRYDTEVEALAVEATLIKWVYGFDNLTNLIQGHHHNTIREKDNFEEMVEIDIEKRDYVRDGTYTRKYEALNEESDAREKLEKLKAALENLFPGKISEVDLSRAQDPAIHIRYDDDIRISCLFRPKTDRVTVLITPQRNTKKYKEKFFRLGNDLRIKVKGRSEVHLMLPGWKEHILYIQDVDGLIKRLQEAISALDRVFH